MDVIAASLDIESIFFREKLLHVHALKVDLHRLFVCVTNYRCRNESPW